MGRKKEGWISREKEIFFERYNDSAEKWVTPKETGGLSTPMYLR
jgi:hypothetical protein